MTPEDGYVVRYPPRLGEVVGDNDDADRAPQGQDETLDDFGRDRIKGAAGLIHQEQLGAQCQGPRNAKPLLLTTGERERRGVQPPGDLFPQSNLPQNLLGSSIQIDAINP